MERHWACAKKIATSKMVQLHSRNRSSLVKTAHLSKMNEKTESSKRTISLDQDTLQALQRQIRLRKKERLRAGPSYQENGLVFAKTDGSPLDPKTITKWFARKGREFRRPDFSVHVTRHTHASLLLLSKDPVIPILAISKRLGHSSVLMTLDTYCHLLPNTDKEAADRMAEILERGVL